MAAALMEECEVPDLHDRPAPEEAEAVVVVAARDGTPEVSDHDALAHFASRTRCALPARFA